MSAAMLGLGASSSGPGETRISVAQMQHLRNVFERNPAILAARNVLHAQLLSSGLLLKKDGKSVEVTPLFRQHLDTHWSSFARDVIDSFLIMGFVVVSYERDDVPSATNSIRERKRRRDVSASANLLPIVAPIGSYDLGFVMTGRAAMQRSYRVYRRTARSGAAAVEMDDGSVLFMRNPPDEEGNINSPVASIQGVASFVNELLSLASVAERSRARPPLVTKTRPKQTRPGAAPTDMYFDTESREIARQGDDEENEHSARALQIQLDLCRLINESRTGIGDGSSLARALGGGSNVQTGPAAELGERMYALPVTTEEARVELPQARGDLVNIIRMALDEMCTAIGVPSSLLFEGRYAGQSTAQLALLNSTVQQLGRKVDTVLTAVYNDIYGPGGALSIELNPDDKKVAKQTAADETIKIGTGEGNNPIVGSDSIDAPESNDTIELVTTTAPMSAAQEVLALFSGGLADFEAAAPLALHSVGMSAAEIEGALDRYRTREEEKKKQEEEGIRAVGTGKPVPPEAGAAGVAIAGGINSGVQQNDNKDDKKEDKKDNKKDNKKDDNKDDKKDDKKGGTSKDSKK